MTSSVRHGSSRSAGEYECLILKRPAPQKVEQYRRRLLTFYRNIFEQNDPGIPTLASPVAPRIDLSRTPSTSLLMMTTNPAQDV
jgi:hypothetical protein